MPRGQVLTDVDGREAAEQKLLTVQQAAAADLDARLQVHAAARVSKGLHVIGCVLEWEVDSTSHLLMGNILKIHTQISFILIQKLMACFLRKG